MRGSARSRSSTIRSSAASAFVGYGNHEQYFYKDYLAYQPEYFDKEMLCARTLKERGYKFVFMEDLS